MFRITAITRNEAGNQAIVHYVQRAGDSGKGFGGGTFEVVGTRCVLEACASNKKKATRLSEARIKLKSMDGITLSLVPNFRHTVCRSFIKAMVVKNAIKHMQ
jgi:hypothetical protein